MRLPTTVYEIEGAEAADRFPTRIARIIDSELARLEAKQQNGRALSTEDLDRLDKAARVSATLTAKRRQRERRQGAGKASPPPEDVLDRMVRELREGDYRAKRRRP